MTIWLQSKGQHTTKEYWLGSMGVLLGAQWISNIAWRNAMAMVHSLSANCMALYTSKRNKWKGVYNRWNARRKRKFEPAPEDLQTSSIFMRSTHNCNNVSFIAFVSPTQIAPQTAQQDDLSHWGTKLFLHTPINAHQMLINNDLCMGVGCDADTWIIAQMLQTKRAEAFNNRPHGFLEQHFCTNWMMMLKPNLMIAWMRQGKAHQIFQTLVNVAFFFNSLMTEQLVAIESVQRLHSILIKKTIHAQHIKTVSNELKEETGTTLLCSPPSRDQNAPST